MAAWLVVTAKIHDREAFLASGYPQEAARLQSAAGGEYIVRGPGSVLEGDIAPGTSVIVTQWPDRASAEAFWNSPEYAAAKKLRKGLAEITCMVVGD